MDSPNRLNLGKIYANPSDEYFTPAYAITPLLPYLKPQSTIWCPFDTPESHYVKVLTEAGHTVIPTHIATGQDFFQTEIPCDYIISNPPFSKKTEILNRLFQLGKPFAMLLGIAGIFDSKQRAELFQAHPFEILYLYPRVSYFTDYNAPQPTKSPPFQSAYVCQGILPKQIQFQKVTKCNQPK